MKELLYAESRGVAFLDLIDGVASPDVKVYSKVNLAKRQDRICYRAAMDTHRPNMQRNGSLF